MAVTARNSPAVRTMDARPAPHRDRPPAPSSRSPEGERRAVTDTAVELLVSRQPILDAGSATVGYELLCHTDDGPARRPDVASASLLVDGFLGQGLQRLTGGLPAWVAMSERMLVNGAVDPFVGAPIVVELLGDTSDTPEVRAALRRLRDGGMRIALGDLRVDGPRLGLVGQVDVVRIDLTSTTREQRRILVGLARHQDAKVLFHNVDDADQAAEAEEGGADLLQGYFFARPVTTTRRDVPLQATNRLGLLQVLHRPDLDLQEVEDLIRQDVYLASRFLTFINAASFGWRQRVDSIGYGLVLVGTESLRRWLGLVILAATATDRPTELLVVAATRARFCENLADALGVPERSLDLFTLGMFSLMEAALGIPLADAIEPMPLADDVAAALLGEHNRLSLLLELVEGLEASDWPAAQTAMARLDLSREDALAAYRGALEWSIQAHQLAH